MKLETVQQALRSIPQVQESSPPSPGEVVDLLGAAAEFSKLLRKVGVQQTREVREILSSFQEPDRQSEQIRQAWQREQDRAAASEQQLRKLADVLIGVFDVLDRMVRAFQAAPEMREWALQTQQTIDLGLHNAEKSGLVALGTPGELLDPAIHDLEREIRAGQQGPVRVSSVVKRGYALNGKILRRATVDTMFVN